MRDRGSAISAPPERHHRAIRFQRYVIGATLLFILLAVAARLNPYFPLDLRITRAVQADHGAAFDRLMAGISWLGYPPQAWWIGGATTVTLFAAGLRWEAVATAFAGLGIVACGLVKMLVGRPRPAADLVQVMREVGAFSFPSGHVVMATTFLGFLAFLTFTLLKPSAWRHLMVAILVVAILLMGVSRIDQGLHWFSDVVGAWLLGSVWLVLSIQFYRWGRPRFLVAGRVDAKVPAEVVAR